METASEKPKRGRPKKYTDEEYGRFKEANPNWPARGKRSQQNYLNMNRAVQIIAQPGSWPDFAFGALGDLPLKMVGYFRSRLTLLSELGRTKDPKLLVRLAHEIFSKNLRGAPARALIRRHRLPGRAPNIFSLLNKIQRVVQQHRAEFPAQDPKELKEDFDGVAASISRMLELSGQVDFPKGEKLKPDDESKNKKAN